MGYAFMAAQLLQCLDYPQHVHPKNHPLNEYLKDPIKDLGFV
jgi:hypothetical protein